MCGEKATFLDGQPSQQGSPPRVRGKVLTAQVIDIVVRITPACAGKSGLQIIQFLVLGDHPRVCGEKNQNVLLPPSLLGSPPRVRGKEAALWLRAGRHRITHACAGKSRVADRARGGLEDHPRVCGEKEDGWLSMSNDKGSPPRVRGKGLSVAQANIVLRITPACAGKSRSF